MCDYSASLTHDFSECQSSESDLECLRLRLLAVCSSDSIGDCESKSPYGRNVASQGNANSVLVMREMYSKPMNIGFYSCKPLVKPAESSQALHGRSARNLDSRCRSGKFRGRKQS
jgi:hypothetical protein